MSHRTRTKTNKQTDAGDILQQNKGFICQTYNQQLLSGKTQRSSTKDRARTGSPSPLLFFHRVFEVLVREIRQEKEKGHTAEIKKPDTTIGR